jgi:hypothetical protein
MTLFRFILKLEMNNFIHLRRKFIPDLKRVIGWF